jgi:hypothetical protein
MSMENLDRVDAMFCVLAAIGTLLTLASAAALVVIARPPLESSRLIRAAAVIEIILVVAGLALAWSGIATTMTRFGAEGMAPMLIAPAARLCAALTCAMTVANVACAIGFRSPRS